MTTATVQEWTTKTVYFGTAEEVVATGIVQMHQLPGQPGRPHLVVYYRDGEQVEPVRRLDFQADPEKWIRIDRSDVTYHVNVGLPRAIVLQRRSEEKEKQKQQQAVWHAKWDAEERAKLAIASQKKAAVAKSELDAMPASRRDYLNKLAEQCKSALRSKCRYDSDLKRYGLQSHGYRMTDASVEAVVDAFDEVWDAIMGAEVLFDASVHQKVRSKHIADLDEGFQVRLAQWVKPNPKLLQGSPS